MNADITPCRRFPGHAKEAMEAYRSIFGGELQMMPFSAIYTDEEVAGQGDRIMHAELIINGATVLFASDIPPGMEATRGEDTPLSITGGPGESVEIRGYWDRLAEGGAVLMPLGEVPWGATFGQLTDRFGTIWMFNIAGQ